MFGKRNGQKRIRKRYGFEIPTGLLTQSSLWWYWKCILQGIPYAYPLIIGYYYNDPVANFTWILFGATARYVCLKDKPPSRWSIKCDRMVWLWYLFHHRIFFGCHLAGPSAFQHHSISPISQVSDCPEMACIPRWYFTSNFTHTIFPSFQRLEWPVK